MRQPSFFKINFRPLHFLIGFCLIFINYSGVTAQIDQIIQPVRYSWKSVFWSPAKPGIYVGPASGTDSGHFALGGEVKALAGLEDIPILTAATFVNYSYILNNPDLQHNIGFGAHFLGYMIETNYRWGPSGNMWTLAPRFAVDIGHIQLAYGYDFPLTHHESVTKRERHRITLKYCVNAYPAITHRNRFL